MIVYCCSDLIFATKIRSTAEALGVVSRPARDEAMLQARLDRVDDGKANDAVTAVFVDMDLGEAALALIRQARQHDAALPIIAFGSHVAAEALRDARGAGATQALPRSSFTQQLPALVQSNV